MAAGKNSRTRGGSILTLAVVLVFGLLAFVGWRVSLPWRILSAISPPEASYGFQWDSVQVQPVRWTDGSLTLLAPAAGINSQFLDLVRRGSVNLLRLFKARVDFTEAPEQFQQISFTRWKNLLSPKALPVDKAEIADASLTLSIFPSPLDAHITAVRNRSGAIDATALVEGQGLSVQGFLRLGWDSLENGGSFEGYYNRGTNPYFFSFFNEEPFRSLLRPFARIEFEGSFVLDTDWRFDQGIRLITASAPSTELAGTPLTELAFSGATVFPNVLTRENRALFEGLLPDEITLFRIEARRRGDGPVIVEVSLNNRRILAMDADSWRDGAAARVRIESTGQIVKGSLGNDPEGSMTFLPIDFPTAELPSFRLPGILEIGDGGVEMPVQDR